MTGRGLRKLGNIHKAEAEVLGNAQRQIRQLAAPKRHWLPYDRHVKHKPPRAESRMFLPEDNRTVGTVRLHQTRTRAVG